jgi:hypothetical protein
MNNKFYINKIKKLFIRILKIVHILSYINLLLIFFFFENLIFLAKIKKLLKIIINYISILL